MGNGPRVVALERIIWSIRSRMRAWEGMTGALGGGGTGPGGPGAGGPGDTNPTTPTGPPGWWGPWGPSWGSFGGGYLLMQYIRQWNMDIVSWDPFNAEVFPVPPEPIQIIHETTTPNVTLNLLFTHGFSPAFPGISVTIKDSTTGAVLITTTTDSAGKVMAPIGSRTEMDVIFTVPSGYYYADDIDTPDPGYGSGDVVTHAGLSTDATYQFRFYPNP